MNQINNSINSILENKSKKEETSDEESFEFFQSSTKNNFLNNKRKISIDDYNGISQSGEKENNIKKEKQFEKESNSSNANQDSSYFSEEEKSKKIKKNKKNINNSFRTVKPKQICQFYINGACKKGDKCPYSHEAEQIHKKELCKFFLSGKCLKGEKCLYSHDLKEIPCKFYHGLGFCENFQNCQFSHERLDEENIKEFIKSNEDFLKETKNKFGRTNIDEFYDKYIKEKEGGEQYIMIPDFIKKEDKEKEKKEKNSQIPLGIIVMSNNNKVINELRNLYNLQNIQNNNIFNSNNLLNRTINNFQNPNYIKKFNDNVNKTKIIQDNKINNVYINNNKEIHNDMINLFNIDKQHKNQINENQNNYSKTKNKDDKKYINEEKNIIPNIEINPFMDPTLISNNDINNLF